MAQQNNKPPEGYVVLRHLNINDTPPEQFFQHVDLVKRPGFNTTGKEISVAVNVFPVTQFPTKTVYQYDVRTISCSPCLVFDWLLNNIIGHDRKRCRKTHGHEKGLGLDSSKGETW